MNIYDYIPSKNIAEHCKEIGHEFNTLEQAVIVANSGKTIAQKHEAYQYIIDNLPDTSFGGNDSMKPIGSLHAYLKRIIKREQQILSNFYKPQEGYVYQVSFLLYSEWAENTESKSTIQQSSCFSTAEQAVADFQQDWSRDRHLTSDIEIAKVKIDAERTSDAAKVEVNYAGEPIYVRNDENDLYLVFIHLPVPFERGDVVDFSDNRPVVLETHPHYCSNPLFPYDMLVSGEKGDGYDAQVGYYYIQKDGMLSWEHRSYWNLEYYKGEKSAEVDFLRRLGRFIKSRLEGEADSLHWLVNAYGTYKMLRDGASYEKRLDEWIIRPRTEQERLERECERKERDKTVADNLHCSLTPEQIALVMDVEESLERDCNND